MSKPVFTRCPRVNTCGCVPIDLEHWCIHRQRRTNFSALNKLQVVCCIILPPSLFDVQGNTQRYLKWISTFDQLLCCRYDTVVHIKFARLIRAQGDGEQAVLWFVPTVYRESDCGDKRDHSSWVCEEQLWPHVALAAVTSPAGFPVRWGNKVVPLSNAVRFWSCEESLIKPTLVLLSWLFARAHPPPPTISPFLPPLHTFPSELSLITRQPLQHEPELRRLDWLAFGGRRVLMPSFFSYSPRSSKATSSLLVPPRRLSCWLPDTKEVLLFSHTNTHCWQALTQMIDGEEFMRAECSAVTVVRDFWSHLSE